jgi:hypothetical protein
VDLVQSDWFGTGPDGKIGPVTDKSTKAFNDLVVKHLTLLARTHKEAKTLLAQIQKVTQSAAAKK